MKKILKMTSIALGACLVLVVVLFFMLVTLVSPNRLKPLIVSQVNAATGRELVIDGNLSWSLFPYLNVKVGHMMLSNPASFKTTMFAEIHHAVVGVKLLPLLHGKIESNGIELTGLTLNLVKTAKGEVNWLLAPALLVQSAEKGAEPRLPASETTNTNQKKVSLQLAISNVDVQDAHITWQDDATHQHIDLDQVEFHAKNIAFGQAFPLSSTFKFVSLQPAASGEGKLDMTVQLDQDKQLYQFKNMYFLLKSLDKHKKRIAVSGDLDVDLVQDTLKLTQWVTQVGDLTLNGNMHITDLKKSPHVVGHLQSNTFDLKALLTYLDQDVPALTLAKDAQWEDDFILAIKDPSAPNLLQDISTHGTFKLAEMAVAKLKMHDVHIQAQFKNGTIDILPITASLYEGSLQGYAKLNLMTKPLQTTLKMSLTHVQAAPLLADLQGPDSKLKVQGSGNVDLQITSAGLTSADFIKHMNGTARLQFANGVIEGIDIGYFIESAFALAKQQALPTANSGKTTFGNLTANATIQNGILSNNDLLLDSPTFTTNGQGTLDLNNQQIDYTLKTHSKEADTDTRKTVLNVYHLTIPIQMTGSLASPSIRVDSADIAKQVAAQQLQRVQGKVEDKLKDVLKGKLPDNAQDLLKGFLNH